MMEHWNGGMAGVEEEKTIFICKKFLSTHYSIIPLFQLRSAAEPTYRLKQDLSI
jgi:hypothetical protein